MPNKIKSYLNNEVKKSKFDYPIEIYYSQSCQDIFVLEVLNYKKNGTYLELGCSWPVEGNNTYLLENQFNWSGLSVDIDLERIQNFNSKRNNLAIEHDASTIDYDNLLSQFENNHIDYLQIDIDNMNATISVIENIDFKKFSFSVITFEHDLYRNGNCLKNKMKNIMEENNYILVCENICNSSLEYPYEDWYVNPNFVDEIVWKKYKCDTVLDTTIFFD